MLKQVILRPSQTVRVAEPRWQHKRFNDLFNECVNKIVKDTKIKDS